MDAILNLVGAVAVLGMVSTLTLVKLSFAGQHGVGHARALGQIAENFLNRQ